MIVRGRHGLPPLPFRVCPRQQYHRPMRIRLAELADAEAIRAIYNVEVVDSTNTFDMVPRTRAEQEAWLEEHRGVHPAVVATEAAASPEDPGRRGAGGEIVLGFGSLSVFRERSGYAA